MKGRTHEKKRNFIPQKDNIEGLKVYKVNKIDDDLFITFASLIQKSKRK